MNFIAPQPPLRWDHNMEDIPKLITEAIEKYSTVMDTVGALDPKDCTFDSVFVTLAQAKTYFDADVEILSLYNNVSPSKEIRDASGEAESLARDFEVESSMRLDVFKSKVAAEKNIKELGGWEKLSLEEQRLVQKMVLDGTRAGLALPIEKREELIALKKELSQACMEFEKNRIEEAGHITFTKDELKGVPDDVVSGYTKLFDDGEELYDITFRNLEIFPVAPYAENPETRKRAWEAFESRLEVNTPVLAKALELRRKIASLLGYKTWADYVTEVKMVKSGKGVEDFLDDLEAKLLPVGMQDSENLLAMKEKEHAALGIPFDGKFYVWDYGYYHRKYLKATLDLDGLLVMNYFPVSVVVPSILQIYQNLLGVCFEEMKDASVWHPDVQAFAAWEKDAKDESGFIGYCYLDLFPRPGKFSHAAIWPVLAGHDLPNGKRSYPVSAIVASLAKPTPEKPALMRHWDVVTLFHEMGHIFHELLCKNRFARFRGTNVVGDFGEAPSQMLENWCWEPRVLEKLSGHRETGKPIPPELVEKLVRSRHVNVGLFYLQQVFLAKFDLKVHTDHTTVDYTQLWCSLREKVALKSYGKECPGQSAFGHLVSGDGVGYYGYTYSQVFSADMYATVFKADPLDPARGKLYREKVLGPGASRDEMDTLKDFLGRAPNSEAFLEQLFPTGGRAKTPTV